MTPIIAIPCDTTWERLEKQYFLYVLALNNGNRTQTAKTLDMSLRTLQRKLRKWRVPHGSTKTWRTGNPCVPHATGESNHSQRPE